MSRYRWVVLAAGTLAQASFSAVLVGTAVLAPAIADRYQLSVGQVGVVLASTSFGFVFSLIPWGLLADRVGERVVMSLGLAGAAAALVGAAYADGYVLFVLLLVVAGLSGASVNSASGRAVMHWFDVRGRGLALGIRQSAIPLGGGVAALVLPQFDLRAALLLLSVGCLAGAGLAGLLVRGGPVPAPTELGRPLRDRRIWRLALGSSLVLVAQVAIIGFVVLFLHQERGLSLGQAAAVLAIVQALGVAIRISAGHWSDRLGSRIVPLRRLSVALAIAMVVSAALVDAPVAVLVPALIAAGALGLSWNGLSFTAAAELAGHARSGAAIGLQQTALALAGSVAPVILAFVIQEASWRAAFALSALGPLGGYAVLGRLAGR